MLTSLSCVPEVSTSGYYVFDASSVPKTVGAADFRMLVVDGPETLETILLLDLEHDEARLGKDFCTRRVHRRKAVYLSDEGVNAYICYFKGEAVGNCELSVFGDTAKIENFAVAPKEQGKGYGTAMLAVLIDIAISKNVATLYLEADEDDAAKELYKKRGFSKVFECTDLFFHV